MKQKNNVQVQECIPVAEGDIVRINFNDGEIVIGEIIRFIQRFGCHNEGTTKVNDMVEYKLLSFEKKCSYGSFKKIDSIHGADCGYITDVIKRNSSKIIAKKFVGNEKMWQYIERTKSTFTGNLSSMIMDLWNTQWGDSQFLDIKKAMRLYELHRYPGMVKRLFSYVVKVRRKAFMKWLIQNRNKMLRLHSEIHREQTNLNTTMEQEYWDDVKNGVI